MVVNVVKTCNFFLVENRSAEEMLNGWASTLTSHLASARKKVKYCEKPLWQHLHHPTKKWCSGHPYPQFL